MSNPIFFFFFFISLIIIIIIPSSFSLNFSLPTIGWGSNLEARTGNGQSYGVGGPTSSEPLNLWNRTASTLADFNSTFFFEDDRSINGLTFIMTPNASLINMPWPSDRINKSSSNYSFLAFRFDTPRVSIDISSMEPVNAATKNFTLGMQNNICRITYKATSMTLRVEFTPDISDTDTDTDSLSYVVDLRNVLPEKVTLGFSSQKTKRDLIESKILRYWNFTSLLVDMPHAADPPDDADPPDHESQPPMPPNDHVPPAAESCNNTGCRLGVGLSVALPTLFFGVAFLATCFLWKKKKCDEDLVDPDMDMEFEKGTGAKKFSYKELVLATKDFAEEGKLGEGGFGGVYRGFLKEIESYIAVKRVSRRSEQGLKEYASEVKIISQLRHRNLVQLLGWCHQRGELLLVYEFMPNGSLDSHLFKSKSILTWEVRYKIAQGLASALLYLHEEWERCVVHRDIKSSNIMLDSNFNAKLGDFGLARLVDHEKGAQTTVLAGTMGYMAPECASTGRASKETDVYSFGIVLLEIACGRRPINHRLRETKKNQVLLVEWVWSLYGMGKLLEAADPNLSTGFDKREMEQLMIVGLWCAHPDSNYRPSIRHAIQILNFEMPLPILPPELPVLTYSSPATIKFSSRDTFSGGVSDVLNSSEYSSSANVTPPRF